MTPSGAVTTGSESTQPVDVGPFRVPPQLTTVTEAFWTGGERGELMIHRCSACSTWFHPPRENCRQCHSSDVAPQTTSGKGVIRSFTINHQQWNPAGYAAPYVIAIVELIEQDDLRLITNIVDCDPSDVEIGAAVTVQFEPLDDVWLPLFRLDEQSDPIPTLTND